MRRNQEKIDSFYKGSDQNNLFYEEQLELLKNQLEPLNEMNETLPNSNNRNSSVFSIKEMEMKELEK